VEAQCKHLGVGRSCAGDRDSSVEIHHHAGGRHLPKQGSQCEEGIMSKKQKERAGLLRNLLYKLAFVMTDPQVMESSNAATNFRNLLAIDRWLNRDLATLVARRTRPPIPAEVVRANYRLHRQDELASEPAFPAEIVGIGARHGAMTVFARFPGHAELAGESEFIIRFKDDDQRLEIVEFQRVDSTTGADLDTPPGALAGLYAAMITTCRNELDQWRIAMAEFENIRLEPAILPEPLAKPPEDA
jgi:hypothetical protein